MALVDYSDSESDVEETPVAKPAALSSAKPAFQKVVDRSNPGKIRVSLPQSALKEEKSSEPPAKRVKASGGGFGGFNSFLPAPKRSGQATGTQLGGANATNKGGIAVGVSLKTGAAPGFSRSEPDSEHGDYDRNAGSSGSALSLPAPRASLIEGQTPSEEVKLVGKPLMFRPLSVARKPVKKKKQIVAASTPESSAADTSQTVDKVAARPKVSMFSMSAEPSSSTLQQSTGTYQPIIYEAPGNEEDVPNAPYTNSSYEDSTPNPSQSSAPSAIPTNPASQSLDDIAGDLHLSAAEKRQLFGRQKGGPKTATNVINFNTDKEYLHNEELRASGEEVSHNPVRAIAPGKHSLKQLVSAAQNQKAALEESFAKGKNNRAEASSRYGW